MTVGEDLRLFAEEPAAWGTIDPRTGLTRVLTDRYCLLFGPVPSFTQVSRLRVAPEEVAETIAEVRAAVAERGHRRAVWVVGGAATPGDLVERLLVHGLEHDDHHTVLVLDHEPPPGPPDVEARRVRDLDEFRTAAALGHAVFGTDADRRAEWDAVADERFAAERAGFAPRAYLAYLEGRAVGQAQAIVEHGCPGVLMISGAVLPDARGRGVYRALVRARWDDAVAAGIGALCVHAGAMSRPILERLGFASIGEVDQLRDPATC